MTDAELTQAILEERQKIDPNTRRATTWEKIEAEHAGVSKALLWKISRGHIVKDLEKRRMLKLDIMVEVPACHVCGATHTHAHGEVVYPAGTATYDRATQEVKPIETKPRKRRDTRIRLHATVEKALYEAVKGQAKFEGTTMDAIVHRGVMLAIYDYQAIMNRQPAHVLHGQNGAETQGA